MVWTLRPEAYGLDIPSGNYLRKVTDAEFMAAFSAGKNDVQNAREINIYHGTVKKRRER